MDLILVRFKPVLPATIIIERIDEQDVAREVVRFSGSPEPGATAERVVDSMRREASAGRVHFVIDLHGVQWINSGGMETLVRAFATAREAGGRLVIIRPTERVSKTLRDVHLDTVIPMLESLEQARKYFNEPPGDVT